MEVKCFKLLVDRIRRVDFLDRTVDLKIVIIYNHNQVVQLMAGCQGMTQQDLADQVGIRRETIVHLENNRYNPSLEMALKIAQVFNKQVEELFRLKLEK